MMLRRGISAVVAGVIVLALFVSIVIPFTLFIFRSMSGIGTSLSTVIQLEQLRELETLQVSSIGTNLTVINTGSVPSGVRYLLLKFTTNDTEIVLDLYTAAKINTSPLILLHNANLVHTGYGGYISIEPGGWIRIELPSALRPKILITTSGKVVNLEKQSATSNIAEVAKSVRVVPITFTNLASVSSLLQQPNSITLTYNPKVQGEQALEILENNFANRTGGILKLLKEYENVYVKLHVGFWLGDTSRGNIIIGFAPQQTSSKEKLYSILITATDFDTSKTSEGYEGYVQIGGAYCEYSGGAWVCENDDGTLMKLVENDKGDYFRGGFRIFIEGLNISIGGVVLEYGDREFEGDNARGFYFYCGTEVDCKLYIEGLAKRVIIYASDSDVVSGCGLQPYFFFTDTDGNGMPEMIFITEDFAPGNINSLGDTYWQFTALDVTKPLWLVFKSPEYAVDSSKYSQILVTLRIYFHDNAGGDTNEVEDPKKFLFQVALIDPDTGEVVSSSSLIYQQLDDFEDTWPPNTNFVTLTVPVMVPDTGKVYYVAIAFQDPYWYDGTIDDVDFTLAVEWVGISFFYRG